MRSLWAVLLLLLPLPAAAANGGLPAETLKTLKDATVFVKVQAGKFAGAGSGFLLQKEKDTGYIVTNHHVVRPSFILKHTVGGVTRPVKAVVRDASVSVVFHSGTRKERTLPAVVLSDDEPHDLAVLKVSGMKDLPRPLHPDSTAPLSETMPVYVVGFPFGKGLSTGKGNPAVTISKGAVSSLRQNEAGELQFLQIDGGINPGNSGGPIVDDKGQVLGIAVARIKDSGIGLAIPARHLADMLKGRIGSQTLSVVEWARDDLKVKVSVRLIDPLARVRSVVLHYVVNPVKGKMVSAMPQARKVQLAIKDQLAAGDITLPRGKGTSVPVGFQCEFVNGDGKTLFTPVAAGNLTNVPVARVVDPRTPAGLQPLTGEALAATLAGLKDSSALKREQACDRLAKAKPTAPDSKQTTAALKPLLADHDPLTRASAVRAYTNWAGKDAAPAYYKMLESEPQFGVRLAVIEGLTKLEGAKAAAAVAARLVERVDRAAAAKALKAMGPAAEKIVAGYLTHKDFGVRVTACKILQTVGTTDSMAALQKASDGLDREQAAGVEKVAGEAIAAINGRR